MTKTNPKQ